MRVAVILAVCGYLVSGVALLAVDLAGRRLASTRGLGPEWTEAKLLVTLALIDPQMALKLGEQCLVTASEQQQCRVYFNRALAGNGRLSAAALGLAVLAERRGDLAEAEERYTRLRARDAGFSARWNEWNFHLRQGTAHRALALAREIAAAAPAQFSADFPYLLEAGLSAEAAGEIMVRAGSSRRALAFARYLGRQGHPAAGRLMSRWLQEIKSPLARDEALGFIAERVSSRKGLDQAAEIWEICIRSGYLRDQRTTPDDSAVLNPNPRLRLPFIPRSFDWSAVGDACCAVQSLSAEGGIRIETQGPVPKGTVLLSKLVPRDAHSTGYEATLTLRPNGYPSAMALAWRAYDAEIDTVLGEVRIQFPGGRSRMEVVSTEIPLSASAQAIFLMLVVPEEIPRLPVATRLDIESVRFERLSGR